MSVSTGALIRPVVPSPTELVRMKSLECTPTRRLSGQSGKGKDENKTVVNLTLQHHIGMRSDLYIYGLL